MGFDGDVRPEGADWTVEAHEEPRPGPRAAVNPRASDREAAARFSETGLTASTAQALAAGGRRTGRGRGTGSAAGLQSRPGEARGCMNPIHGGSPSLKAACGRQTRIRRRLSPGARPRRPFRWAGRGAKGAGPILTAACRSHSPARLPAHLGGLRTSASLCRLIPCFLSFLVGSRIRFRFSLILTPRPGVRLRE